MLNNPSLWYHSKGMQRIAFCDFNLGVRKFFNFVGKMLSRAAPICQEFFEYRQMIDYITIIINYVNGFASVVTLSLFYNTSFQVGWVDIKQILNITFLQSSLSVLLSTLYLSCCFSRRNFSASSSNLDLIFNSQSFYL